MSGFSAEADMVVFDPPSGGGGFSDTEGQGYVTDETSMSVKNISETLFENYLRSQGLSFEFEKPYAGKSKLVDYTVPIEGRDFLFEVKQFEQKNYPLPQGGATYIDPCRAIRSKIDQAKDKFKEYEEFPCCLVMYNSNDAFVMETEPQAVLGAMYGEIGIQIPVSAGVVTIAKPVPETTFVGDKGGMVRKGKERNTRISALITLYEYYVGSFLYSRWLKETAENLKTRAITDEDIREPNFDVGEKVLAVSVWKNVYAAVPFPNTVFCGPCDEHWGLEGDYVRQTFIGPRRFPD